MSIAGAIVGGAMSLGSGLLTNYFAKKAASAQAGRNWYYYQKEKKLDYDYDSNQYYNLARKYQENSAKWQIEGMKRAGVNPILAYGSLGDVNSMQGSSANSNWSSQSSPVFDLGESSRDAGDFLNRGQDTAAKKMANEVTKSTLAAAKDKPQLENDVLRAQKDLIDKQAESAASTSAKNAAETSFTRWKEEKDRAESEVNPIVLLGKGVQTFKHYGRKARDATSELVGDLVGRSTQATSDFMHRARGSVQSFGSKAVKAVEYMRSRAKEYFPHPNKSLDKSSDNNSTFRANPIMMFH